MELLELDKHERQRGFWDEEGRGERGKLQKRIKVKRVTQPNRATHMWRLLKVIKKGGQNMVSGQN